MRLVDGPHELDWKISRLQFEAYLGDEEPPDELVRSVRCIVLRGGEVLVLRNSDGLYHVVPGGRREPGEAQLDTLRRELVEETGWTIDEPRRLGYFKMRFLNEPTSATHFYPEFFQTVFVAQAIDRDCDPMDEYELECAFRPVSEALAMKLEPGNAAMLEAALAALRAERS